jgi:hypothetical protein
LWDLHSELISRINFLNYSKFKQKAIKLTNFLKEQEHEEDAKKEEIQIMQIISINTF